MAYVVSITGTRPPVRHDALPWTQARIEEAPTEAGPWTALETRVLDPVDADPSAPRPRSFTTELATNSRGWHRVVFVDATDDEAPTDATSRGIIPTLEEVAALVPTYTVGAYGAPGAGTELGTFTVNTTPTAAQVEQLILQAAGDLTTHIDEPVTDDLRDEARRLVTLRAAALVIASRAGEEYVDAAARHPFMAMYLSGVEALDTSRSSRGWVY